MGQAGLRWNLKTPSMLFPPQPQESQPMTPFPFPRPALACCLLLLSVCVAQAQPLPGTGALVEERPLDVVMVEGIDRFALREIERARESRASLWDRDHSSAEAYAKSIAANRQRFRTIIGAVDRRAPPTGLQYIATTTEDSLVAENERLSIHAVRWPVLAGVTAEGLLLKPKAEIVARVVAIPDADWTPEMISGLAQCDTSFALDLATMGCEVLVPTLINRDDTHSANPEIGRKTNQTHREFVYRQAFELGRHIIGYEVQKVLAAVDQFTLRNQHAEQELPIAVMGVSEGGLLALYAGALDDRIDEVVVSGYFVRREEVWKEPIYRNVWRLLHEFGDAEIASMIAPRHLLIEVSPMIQEYAGPPLMRDGRRGAAPGTISRPERESVIEEYYRASEHWTRLGLSKRIGTIGKDGDPPLNPTAIKQALDFALPDDVPLRTSQVDSDRRQQFSAADRQQQQLAELVRFTQRLLALCHRTRDQTFSQADRSSVESWVESSADLRDHVHRELFGKLPTPSIDPNPRSRQILDEPQYAGYEIALDVYPDVIASGILLMPKDLRPNERRPVVVCQHGLEGTPMDTISTDARPFRAYKSFSAELVKRGFIVYAPQNPYRGQDAFRTLQRKSNPLGRSLFSYIIPQHLVTLRWLSSIPLIDKDRIGFYGLSYGGKTAVRVPPMLPPTETEPGYCLSICSADFNEWVAKNASYDARFSYIWTGEYEIFEWNMGHVANYAELSMLMTPRPFMVERGHDDGVGIDEWVAWEYAKVRRHYNKLGIGDKTEIEFFDGPHTINGRGTFDFLHRHLNWPLRQR